jgi:exoribonuclease-2
MLDGQVILFRRHGEYVLGRFLNGPKGKLQIDLGSSVIVRINPQQVVSETNSVVDAEAFNEWRDQCQDVANHLDLEDVWAVVHGELTQLTLVQLANLYWGSDLDALKETALQIHLWQDHPYFTQKNNLFTPRSPEQIEIWRRQREQKQSEVREEFSFLRWLSGEESRIQWTRRQKRWLEQLQGFLLHGDSYHASGFARKLLHKLNRDSPDPQRMAFNLLVDRGIFQEDEPLGLYRVDVPLEFSSDSLEASAGLLGRPPSFDDGRRDLTDLAILTIDEASTKDMDDGLSLHETSDGYNLGIHITDVASLIPANGVLDAEAARRMATLYLPERTLSMLPPRLTEELGSLSPGNTRQALSLLIHLDQEFEPTTWGLVPSIVKSHVRLTYEEVDKALVEGEITHWAKPLLLLESIAQKFRHRRLAAGALEFNRPELKIHVELSGEMEVSVVPVPTPARRLVAEFMILANHLMGEFCLQHKLPAVYRVQEAVEVKDLEGIESPALKGFLLMRRLRPSSLVLDPSPHALLGVPLYLQATSPLRRYLDLMIQRQILHQLHHGTPLYNRQIIEQVMFQASFRMGELTRLEEGRKRYWLLKYLMARTGTEFQAVVLDLRRNEAVVELLKFPFRTKIHLTRIAYPGEIVVVQLQEIDLWQLTAHFTLEEMAT